MQVSATPYYPQNLTTGKQAPDNFQIISKNDGAIRFHYKGSLFLYYKEAFYQGSASHRKGDPIPEGTQFTKITDSETISHFDLNQLVPHLTAAKEPSRQPQPSVAPPAPRPKRKEKGLSDIAKINTTYFKAPEPEPQIVKILGRLLLTGSKDNDTFVYCEKDDAKIGQAYRFTLDAEGVPTFHSKHRNSKRDSILDTTSVLYPKLRELFERDIRPHLSLPSDTASTSNVANSSTDPLPEPPAQPAPAPADPAPAPADPAPAPADPAPAPADPVVPAPQEPNPPAPPKPEPSTPTPITHDVPPLIFIEPKFKDVFSTAASISNFSLALLVAIVIARDQVCKGSKSYMNRFAISLTLGASAILLGLIGIVEGVVRSLALGIVHLLTICGKPKWLVNFKVKHLVLAPATISLTGKLAFQALIFTWKYNTPIYKEKALAKGEKIVFEDEKMNKLTDIKSPCALFSEAKRLANTSWPSNLVR